jgi:ABC-type transport system involved in cytochrome bd biosynthesis fused ATPase/permease subunit
LDDGTIAESGTHDDLLSKGGIYAEMHARQLQNEHNDKDSSNLAVDKT